MVSTAVQHIVEKVFAGQPLTHEEVRQMYTAAPHSEDSDYLHRAAYTMIREASRGNGYLFAQIGMDANPCPGNCQFCSFAACNTPWKDRAEVPLEVVTEYAQLFSDNGVHLISLMVTAGYRFGQLLDAVRSVRRVIDPHVALMVNMGDFGPEEAKQLKAAGADIIYHAVRVGEGVITGIPVEVRRATIWAAREAGILVASGIEPLYHGSSMEEIVARTLEVAALGPVFTGVCDLICVKGTKMEHCSTITAEEKRIARAACHLAMGRGRSAFGSNVRWVDAGTNPRMTKMLTGADRIRADIRRACQDLISNEWTIAPRDRAIWKIYDEGADMMSGCESKESISRHYGKLAEKVTENESSGCCCCSVGTNEFKLYDAEEIAALPQSAVHASLGCGNPLSAADLKEGDRVLDLGCGGGIDVLLAARCVGDTGFVYGLDMTEEMLELAERNKEKAGAENVAFIKGDIEDIPMEAESLHVVISNCVINLSRNKLQVLKEAYRVLKAGGRFCVADIVQCREVDEDTRGKLHQMIGCVSGAMMPEEYEQVLRQVGFSRIGITVDRVYTPEIIADMARQKGMCCLYSQTDPEKMDGAFAGALITAEK